MASNLWVAVGSGGTGNRIVTSADGTTWTNTGSTVIDPKAVAYKNNLWVAVGRTGNSIATSTDGVLWTGRGITMFSTGSGYCVAFGNNLWVAGGYGGANSIETSADGITWTSRTSTLAYTNGLAYGKDGSGNGLWVAVGSHPSLPNTIATSTNGSTWTNRSGFGYRSGLGVAYGKDGSGNGLWVAVGGIQVLGEHAIMTSSDGITWMGRNSTILNTGNGVAYGQDGSGAGLWVVVGRALYTNSIATSYDGITWTGRTGATDFTGQGKSVTYANGLWVATFEGANSIATSTNGINWTVKINPLINGAYGVVGPTKATLLTNYYLPTKKMGDASFNIIPPTSNNYGAITYTSSNTAVATIVGSKINVVGVGTSTITAVQEETFSYLSGTNTATFQVIQSTVGTETVLTDFSVPTKIIGDASFNLVAPTTNSDGSFVYTSSNTAVATIVGNTVTIVGVGTSTISAIQLMTPDYATATVTAPFVVNQITTVLSNFSVPTKTFGDVSFGIVAPTTNGNGSFSYASSDTTVATISGDRITVVGGGSSTITATQASTTNYTSATTTATLTVNQATTVLSNFSIGPKTIADASFTIPSITTNSTGLFSYTSSDPTVATIAGNVATIVGIGSATITADQASNANFLAATISTTVSVSRNLWVAVGQGTENTVASSYDGIVWKGLGLGGAPQSIAYSNNLWVAVGSGANTVAYSTTNGNKWIGFGSTVFSTRGYRILYDPDAALWIAIGQGGNSIATSTTPKTSWTGHGLIFPSATCVYGPATNYSGVQNFSGYLLGGYSTGSLLANSSDGTTWQMGTTSDLASQGFNTIAYGNGVYVAGGTPTGSGNSFATSTDQITWTGRGGSTNMTNVNQITYGNGIFIAVGSKGTAGSTIMKSTDGVTWTILTNVYGSYLGRCVAYYQGRWIVGGIGNYGTFYSDDNGTTWTNSSSSYSIYSTQTNAIAYGNNILVSVGQGTVNTLAISTDFGVSWTGKGILLSGSGNDIKYIDGLWLAVGGDNVSTGNIIVKSTDNGTTWTQVATSSTSYFTSLNSVQNVNGTWYISGRGAYYLAYSNTSNPESISDFVMVSTVSFTTNGACLSTFNYQKPRYIVGGKGMKGSVTGLSWFDILNQPFTKVNDVYWNGTIWVGVGECLMPVIYGWSSTVRNTIAYSYDGINWIGLGATIFGTSGNNVYYSTTNSLWIATGSGTNTIATSVDGINWTGRGTTVFTTAGGRITYYNNLLVAVGEGSSMIATSTNGISWDTNARIRTGRTVAYINNQWVVAGDGATFATSTNGMIWRDFKPTVTNGLNNCYSIAYGNGKWVAVGTDGWNSGKITYSTDGINWTGSASNAGINGYVYKVVYGQDGSGNGLWVAAGSGTNSIATSTDGITWTSRSSIFGTARGVAYGNGLWVAVGQGTNAMGANSIATSTNGITWTIRNSNAFGNGYGVAYANGLWVAVGANGGGTATSTDGITWTARSGIGYYEVGYNVAYGNGLWVSVSSGQSFTSPDGITWTARAHKLTSGYDVAYSNGLWVICGYAGITSSFVSTSTDGITWTLRNENVFNGKGYDVVGPENTVTKITTVLGNFSVPVKTFGDSSFGLVPPTTNSDGVITYTSSNPAVATIVDNVVTIVRTGSTTITAYQANTANYSMGSITATFTVNKITTVLTDFAVPEKTFADASFNLVAPTTNSDGPITYTSSNTAVATVSGSRITIVGGGTATITATQATTPIYAAQAITASFLVNQKTTVLSNFSEITKTFGDASFNLVAPTTNSTGSFTYTSSNTAVATIAGSTVTIVGTGTATITANQASNVNFLAQTITTTMTVSQATPAITKLDIPAKIIGAAPFALVPPISNSTGAFTYTSSDTAVATIDGTTVTIVGLGITTITAVQASTANYISGTISAPLAVVTKIPLSIATGQGGNSIATSTDLGFTWTGRGTTLSSGYGVAGPATYDVSTAYANFWITGGWADTRFGNAIVISTDGVTLNDGMKNQNTIYGFACANNLLVAVSAGLGMSGIAYSINGITWNNGVGDILSGCGVAYGAGLWVATGYGTNTIATSTNGINWVGRGAPITYSGRGVAFGKDGSNNNLWVAVGNETGSGNTIASSSDGITWTTRVGGSSIFFTGRSVAFGKDGSGNNLWVAVGSGNNTIATSANGTVWTGRGRTIFTTQGWCVAYDSGAGLWVAVGEGGNTIATSTDGVNWSGRGTTIFTNFGSGVAYANNQWVAVGNGGNYYATSVDGINWTGRGGSTFFGGSNAVVYCVAYAQLEYAKPTYVAVGTGTNTIVSSLNGTTWTSPYPSPFTTTGFSVAWNGISWVAVGSGENTIAYSADGIRWTGNKTIITSEANVVAYGKDGSGNGLWVSGGSGGNSIATSTNGIVWTGRGATSMINPRGIAYGKDGSGNGLWVAVGGGNTIATSTNGIIWTGRGATVFTSVGYAVTYANNLWVAVGAGGNTIATSRNGTTWTGLGLIMFTQGNGIRYTNNLWVATGQGGNTLATSLDGTNWVGRGSTLFTTAGRNVLGLITVEPTLFFTIPLRNIGDAPFTIVPPTSNSTGLITYTSSNTEVATIDGSTVTIVGMGTSTITAVQESTDYFISGTTTATLTVENVKPVVTDFSVPEKTFGDAAFSIVSPISNSDGIFTYTSSNTAVATVAGSTITIVSAGTSTITASQAITADYGSATITATLTVNKATPTITNFSAITKTFGNAAFGLVAPTSNSTGAFTYTSSNTAVATIAGSTVTIVGGGTAIITVTQATTANYLAGTTTATMTVNQATPTITNFSVPAKVTENAPFTIVNPTSNSSGAFTYTSSDTSVATMDGSMVTIIGKGTSTITATQASTTNYLSGSIIATFIVRLTPVITNFSAITKTFGDASFSIVAPTTDSDGAITYTSSNTAVATVSGTTITIVSAGTSTITASQSLTANYVSGTITTTLTVNKATPTITNFSAITKTFGNAAFGLVAPTSNSTGAFTYTSSNTAVATIAGSTVTIVGGGTATITATQATTTNYLAGTTTATITVNKATPILSNFSAITKTFGNAAFSIAAPTSNSAGSFTYTSSNTAVATIAGSTVTIVGVGTATITASQADTTNYLAGTTTATMTVSQATPTITIFDVPAKAIGTAPFSLVAPTSNSSGAFTYTSSNTSVARIDGSMVTIVGLGNTTITAVQASTTNYLSGSITGILAIMTNVPLSISVGSGGNSIATSIDRGLTWKGLGTTVFTSSGSCVAFGKDGSGNNLLVAVGQGGNTIATSTNGTTWIGRGASVFTTQGIGVTYANNLWVAVGQGTNSIATSTDGTVWTGRGTSIFSNQGIGVAFNNGLWVAVGQGTNSIATSPDGITWTGRTGTSIFSNQGIGVAFNNGLWVAVGDGTNSIATSTNGTVWTGRGKTALSGWGRGVAYGNGLWVAVGQGTNSIATSPDGITWTGRTGTSIFSNQGIGVAFNSGLWIAVGQGTNSTATSPDGTVWTGRGTSIFSTSGFGVAVGIITPPNITGISPSAGAIVGGTSVTITGTNFTGAKSVTFDGISATTINVVNSTTITCITPARSAGAVGIIVTTEDGPSGEFSSFTYITPPSITGILPSSGSTEGGTNVTITGTSFIGVTSVTFDGLAATTINVVNNTTITCITPARSVGDVGIIVTTLYGTSNTFSPFTYITPPNITSISQLTGSTAGETNVTIRGTNFTGATLVTFGGLAATSLNIVNSTTITCITPARTAGAVDIIVTTGGGPSGAFSSFTYITPPNITSISPSSGSTIGGTIVTITGTNFTGATLVTFGGLVATNINVVNSTTITCITRDRTAGTGAVDIIVTTGGGPSDAFSSYTYITPPVVTSISPLTGSTAGGTSVTITGTSFTGATLVTFSGLAATSLNVVNSTTITCITPVRGTGAAGIIVKTPYGTSVAFSSFTYITPPVISRISSPSGGIAGGTNVTITGKNFTGATLVTFGGLAATTINVVNSTTITCITPANSAGAVGIIVTTGGGPSGTFSSFTYITPPNITSISQLTGSTEGGTSVTITGTNFTGATSVTFDGLAATTINVVNSTTITCITPAHITGAAGIIVTTVGGSSGEFSSFTYITPPVISSISSSSGSTLGGTSVTITGTNFTGATSVTFGGLSATSLSIVNSTTITCITPARTTAGDVGIIVTTGGGPSGAFSSFTYITPPNIIGISPPYGSITGGTSVTITGTNFTGATLVTFGGIAATTINVVNSTTITCITPPHNAGAVDIIVTTDGGSSGAFSSFTYITSSVISSILPSSGSTAGGTNVTITGTNFTGATSVTFDGLAATTINVVNSNTITCITPAHSDGAVGIIVTTGGGPSDAFSSFTYITPPSITDISPSSGINTGGTSVTITGTNFTGATSVTFGGVAATSLSIVNNTTITCITPAVLSDGDVGIIVTTGGGPSGAFSSFTYITSPVISSISPSSGGIAGGTNVTITGINFTGATSVTFGGLAATTINVVNSTTITCSTPAHNAGAVGIIVTTEGGPSGEFSSFTYITPPNITGILSSSGSTLGGTNVTITGTNFTGATSVTFDSLAATTISVVDNTTITCITPAHTAGDVGIIVTTQGGSSDAFSSFTYITPPNITDISQLTGSTAGGTSVTITGTSFTGATLVTFGGIAATSLIIVDSTTITCITPAHITGAVGIIVTTGGGPSSAFSSFTYITPPNITSISKFTGSTLGGTSVTITGTSFTGATSVTFGGLSATSLIIVDSTTITCITPARTTAEAVGIIVTTGGGPSNTFSQFTYITPPSITSISQLVGSTLGGTNVTITGTSFTGATSVTLDGLSATSISVVNNTTITCITPARTTAGAVGIIVTTEYGSSDAFSSFTYITPPIVTSISPLTGSTAGGTSVTITGTSFTGATSVTFGGIAATSLSVVNNTTITCITPARSDGAVDIIVTTLYGTSNTFSSFTYIAPPNITGISQLTGSTAGGTSVTITGTSFTGATSVTFGGIAATSLSIVDSTTITCITPARATAGAVSVIVTTGGGPSGPFSSYTYIVPPNIKSILPLSVSRVGGTSVTITGTNFIGATSVTLGGLNATSFNVVSNTSITFITPARTTGGMVGVIVTTGGGPSNTFSTFVYVPFVSAILPTFGTRSGGTAVKITGIGFTGATSVTFGGIPATNLFVFNPTTITCRTPPGIAAEAVGVIVSTRDGPSNTFSSFTYITPPNITGISPSYGGTVGGMIVTITGKSFTGVSSVLFGGVKVKSLKVIDDTTITCVTAPRTTPGPVDITVQNSIGISNVFSSYTYIITPKLTSISPNFGSTTGGNTVTIIGTDFIGATEVTVGDLSCSTFTVIDNNTLTCITPARIAPGPVGIIVTTGGGPTKKSSPFTYILPPVITSISPPFGGTTGGNVVTITGINFKGASSVLFGGLSATTVKAVNDTTITCKTPVTLTAGEVDVIVRTGGGPSNTFLSFMYITPPVISDISPPAGSTLGGNIVTITGTNLTGATSVLFGKAASTNITVVNDTTLTCRTPLNKSGASGVIVRTGGGPNTIFASFTFVTPPSISGISPLTGSTNGGTLVTLKGKDFIGATSVTIGGVEATSFTVVSATIITCITPACPTAGGVGIIVTTAGGPSKQFSFFNYITPPVITSLSPSTGSTAGGTIVTITGTNFTGATSVTINGKSATPIKVVDNTTITCKAPINLIAGPVDVIVTTGGGPSSAFSSYTYITPAVITSISPTFGAKAGGTSVTITGTNLTGASNLLFGLNYATNIIVVNDTTITCVTPVSANPVAVGITLTTGGGLSNKFSSFTYR